MQILDVRPQQRQNALRALLVFTLPAAALFSLLNVQLGAPTLALLSLALLFVSAGLLVALHRKAPITPLALIYLSALYSNLVVAIARPDIHPGTTSWMVVLPVLAYLLLGMRHATWVAAAAVGAAIAAYFAGAAHAPYRMQLMLIAHVMTPMLGLYVVTHFYSRSRKRSDEGMLERVLRDPLTGLWNREKLARELEREQQRRCRTGMPLSLFLIDLDHFKQLNDRHGHEAGDAALAFFAQLLKQRVRETDLPCRIGGEEFAVLLPDTAAAGAVRVAEDLRQALEVTPFRYRDESIQMTLSAGVVEFGRDGDDWQQLYRAADVRLYACKANGRNCVLSDGPKAA